jgi:serine protease inhibitor
MNLLIPLPQQIKTMMHSCLIIVTMLSVSCKKNNQEVDKSLVFNPTNEQIQFVQRSNHFAFALAEQQLAAADAGQNVLVSPLSVQIALAMTYQGAKGQTATEMIQTLQMEGVERSSFNDYFKLLGDYLPKLDSKTELSLANSIWYKKDLVLRQPFLEHNERFYKAQLEELDFSLPTAPDRINQWVNQHTKGKISEIIKQIPSNTALYLINAVYFKGVWKYTFDAKATHKLPFQLSSGQKVSVDFMTSETAYHFFKNEYAEGIELPYGNGAYSMVALKPKSNMTLDALTTALKNGLKIPLDSQMNQSVVKLYMPKFKFEYEDNLNTTLETLGMPTAFTREADFSGMLEEGGIRINEVKHKTFIEVDEKGTEAAAVTKVAMTLLSAQPTPSAPIPFHLDEPFLVLLREAKTGLILFVGQVQNPIDQGK